MDESGNHYSQQTDRRTENQTLHVLTHRWVLNIWTQGGEHHTRGGLLVRAKGGTARGQGSREGIALGEIPNVDDYVIDAANHHGKCIPM